MGKMKLFILIAVTFAITINKFSTENKVWGDLYDEMDLNRNAALCLQRVYSYIVKRAHALGRALNSDTLNVTKLRFEKAVNESKVVCPAANAIKAIYPETEGDSTFEKMDN